MKHVLWLLALLGALLVSAAPVLADDGFYVVGGRPSVGTRITSLPYTISTPGYYYLGGNLSYADGHAITVDADNVTIDLMGFTLTGPSNGYYHGIRDLILGNNLEVRNGTISGWVAPIVTFRDNQRIIGVRSSGNTYGITMGGANNLVMGCTASQGSFDVGGWGISIKNGTISGCTVMNFNLADSSYGLIWIGKGTASGNVVFDCTGVGIKGYGATTISHNQVSNCTTGIESAGGGSVIGNDALYYSAVTDRHCPFGQRRLSQCSGSE